MRNNYWLQLKQNNKTQTQSRISLLPCLNLKQDRCGFSFCLTFFLLFTTWSAEKQTNNPPQISQHCLNWLRLRWPCMKEGGLSGPGTENLCKRRQESIVQTVGSRESTIRMSAYTGCTHSVESAHLCHSHCAGMRMISYFYCPAKNSSENTHFLRFHRITGKMRQEDK